MYQLKMQQITKYKENLATKSNVNINSSFHLRKDIHTYLYTDMWKSSEHKHEKKKEKEIES